MTQLPEWSRPVEARTITHDLRRLELGADAAERAALAARFGLVGIDRLTARFELRRVEGDLIRVTGRVEAEVVQTCVVSLEPFPAAVRGEIDELFGEGIEAGAADEWLDPEADDQPEPVENGAIDLGELAAQHLSLELDPHPRKPGATLGRPLIEDEPSGPFDALRDWKGGR
jgi:uncharacterized metal-binding protein YceD (DUF177 family)